jgi:hypothetical protein
MGMITRATVIIAAVILAAVLGPASSVAGQEEAAGEALEPDDEPAPAGPVEEEAPPAAAQKSGYKIPDIVEKIKALQGKIKQSQQRMDEVVGIVLNTSDTKGAKAILSMQNKMSGSFVLIQTVVTLDGAPIFKKSDDDGLLQGGEGEEMEVFNGAILPGEHTLSVLFVYRGAGYGIFSYLKGYRFKVRSSHKFEVKEGKGTKITVVGYEKGDEETKMENRPAVKYIVSKIEMD